MSPTLNYNVGDIASLPVMLPSGDEIKEIKSITNNLIEMSSREWDSFEMSLDFKKHPLI